MREKSKVKNIKPLPDHIEHAGIIWLMLFGILGIIISIIIASFFKTSTVEYLPAITIVSGLIFGWWRKFRYAKQQADEQQAIRIKAQFWGWLAMGISLLSATSLLLIVGTLGTFYILSLFQIETLEGAEALIPILSIIVCIPLLLLSFWIAKNAKQRVYNNFGYTPSKNDFDI